MSEIPRGTAERAATVEELDLPVGLVPTSVRTGPDLAHVLVMPYEIRGDLGIYRDADLMAVKLLRSAGVAVDWAHDADHRRFASQYSATAVLGVGLFIAQALGEESVVAIARYLLSRFRSGRSGAASEAGPAVAVDIAHAVIEGDRRELKGVRVSGADGEKVVEAVRAILDTRPYREQG